MSQGDPKSPLSHRLVGESFGVRDGYLAIGGRTVAELADRHGTPLYVYDAAILRHRLSLLRKHLPERIDVYYSVKANPNPEVIRCLVSEEAGAEIASGGEFLRARAAGCAADRILFAGPGKADAELEFVVREGIGEIHVESDEEIASLEEIAGRLGQSAPVAVRVNPAASASGGAMRMGGQPAAFGFDEELLTEVVRRLAASPHLHFQGIHMFAGTQILDAEVLVGQWRHAVELARRAAESTGEAVATVDLGGGLGIPYFQQERALDLSVVRELSHDLFSEVESDAFLRTTRFILEPGRFLAGPAGVYLARVRSVKVSRGRTFVILDGGMHHHLAASGNLGQVIKRDYPLVNASRMEDAATQETTVVGPLCTPLDTLGRKVPLPHTKPGDLVAVLQSGAYGLTASPVGFLSHPMPAEVLVEDGTDRLVRARGSFDEPLAPLP